jgi:iron complex transport system substrate-binding protein
LIRLLAFLFLACAVYAQPKRIVSTAPGLTEILFALGLEQKIVGVSEYCRYPEAALRKPKVGSFLQPNLETIAALKPDVVLILKNPVRLKQRLEALGLKVVEVDLETMPGILEVIGQIGQLTGQTKQATSLRSSLEARLNAVRSKMKQRRRVAFLVGRTPQRLEGMIAVGPNSYLEEILKAAGGDNVFADSPTMYPKISIEQLLARDPDFILEMGDSVHEGIAETKYRENVLAVWAKLSGLRAVREKRVVPLNDSIYVVPGPRFADAAEKLFEILNGGPRR